MIGSWSINVSGRLYGPFSSERMRSFASEGRLTSSSLVAREGTTDWHEAREEPEFSDMFSPPPREPVPAFGKSQTKAAASAATDGEANKSHFVIVIDQKSGSSGNLDPAINSLGTAYRLMQNIWIMSTDKTVNAVRNRLVQELGKHDSLFVIDASRGKAAWFNFGPEADVRIRRVWQKTT